MRWFQVGCISFGIDWSIYVILYPHIASVVLTNLISGSCYISFNYFAHLGWTFKSKQRQVHSGPRYAASFFVEYLLNTVFVKIFNVTGIVPGEAKLLADALQTTISYLILNFFDFKRTKTVES